MKKTFAISLSALLFAACGEHQEPTPTDVPTLKTQDANMSEAEQVGIAINLTASETGLLFQADDYTITVDGCVSGYNGTFYKGDETLKVLRGDRDCLAKLTSITFAGKEWFEDAEDPFESHAEGDLAKFSTHETFNEKLYIRVDSQLSSPIVRKDKVEYQIHHIKLEDSDEEQIITFDIHTDFKGDNAPNFEVITTRLKGITPEGAGRFAFQLQCNDPLEFKGFSFWCSDNNLKKIRYILIDGPMESVPSLNNLQELFATEQHQHVNLLTDVWIEDIFQPSTGGFWTKKCNRALTGPAPLMEHREMTLILEHKQESYQIFNIYLDI